MLSLTRPVWLILIGASLMLTLAMGLRQSLGIFMPSLTADIGISVSDFTLAIAVQNLVWGFMQPVVGALVVRTGFRGPMLFGAVLYLAGLALLSVADGMIAVLIGAGFAIGVSMACCGPALAMAATARAVPAAVRSTVLGVVSAAGSLGAMFAAPFGQALLEQGGWREGIIGFAVLSAVMLPAAWYAARADKVPLPAMPGGADDQNGWQALAMALRNAAFVVMTVAYFVCGMQLVFLTTHLPAYLEICGMQPMLGAQALGLIGGFNVLGSLFFGWAGGRWNKLALLGGIYVARSCLLVWYFRVPPSPESTLIFASAMGFLWLGVAPLVAGWIVDTFGLRWQAMLGGVAFVSHQVGSFVGAFGGGLIFDLLGSYDAAWVIGVAVGLAAGVTQIAVAFRGQAKPPPPVASPA